MGNWDWVDDLCQLAVGMLFAAGAGVAIWLVW